MSNAFTVTGGSSAVSLTATPTSVAPGGTVTATFSNVSSPTSNDWIAVYAQGAADSAYKTWFYDSSCTFTPGTAKASGSCTYTVPTNLPAGLYEFRLFSNNSWTRLAVSNAFTVTGGSSAVSLTATPTIVGTGDTVTATFSNVSSPTSNDWIAVYAQGAADSAYKTWFYDSSCTFTPGTAKASGSCTYTVPTDLPAGLYEFRLFSNSSWTRLAVSNAFTVNGGSSATSLTVTPTTVAAGGRVNVAFNNVTSPTSGDWIAVYTQGSADAVYMAWFYNSTCTSNSGTAMASGSCTYTLPTSLTAGLYELRLFANDSWTRLAVSNAFSVY